MWGCETGLPDGAFHVVVATYAPQPSALIPWIWNLGLSGAQIWIYHRLASDDPRLAAAAAALSSFEPYPCGSAVRLQQLLPNKGREAAAYLSHIVRHYGNLPYGMALVHDHGPAARHSLCGPFFRRLRGYYAGVAEQLQRGRGQGHAPNATAEAAAAAAEAAPRRTLAETAGAAGRHSRSRSGAGGTGGGSGSSRGASKRDLLARFADTVVSLSSGCQENWLKGCCALLVCAEDGEASPPWETGGGAEEAMLAGGGAAARLLLRAAEGAGGWAAAAAAAAAAGGGGGARRSSRPGYSRGRCPFKTSRCLANASALSTPLSRSVGGVSSGAGGTRWLYMHGGGGLYDTRYENLVVLHGETPEAAAAAATAGLSNLGFGPLSLVRYAGADAVETVRAATSSSRGLDYPEGAASRSVAETYGALGSVLGAHGFAQRKAPGNFKSCCASLILRPHHVRHWPLSLYEQMLSYTLDERNTYHASLAVSHHGWALWAGPSEVGPSDLLRYFEVDLALLHIRGCPGWRFLPAAPGGNGTRD